LLPGCASSLLGEKSQLGDVVHAEVPEAHLKPVLSWARVSTRVAKADGMMKEGEALVGAICSVDDEEAVSDCRKVTARGHVDDVASLAHRIELGAVGGSDRDKRDTLEPALDRQYVAASCPEPHYDFLGVPTMQGGFHNECAAAAHGDPVGATISGVQNV
jgi:hypothetical protein